MRQIKILLVEDDPSIRELLRVLLEGEGYEISEATDGVDGLAKAEHLKPDLMILDLMMPEVDGERLLGTMRGVASLARVPVIVVSGKEEDALDRVRELLGPENVFPKPFEPIKLLDRVELLVGLPGFAG